MSMGCQRFDCYGDLQTRPTASVRRPPIVRLNIANYRYCQLEFTDAKRVCDWPKTLVVGYQPKGAAGGPVRAFANYDPGLSLA